MSVNLRKKIPETCRYWKEGKCFKGEFQCNFVHGYVCPDDGRCWREYCSRMHIIQKKHQQPRDYSSKQFQNHQRQGHHSGYRRSPSRSMRPVRHQKTVFRGRSPPRYRSRSRSPPHHQSRGYSPPHRHSRSLSPSRIHGRSWSTSWRESKSRSPSRPRSRSCSPIGPQSRSCIPERSRSRSHSPAEIRSRSHIPAQSRSRSRSIVQGRQQDLDDIYADLDEEFDGETEEITYPKSDQNDQKAAEKIALSEIQAHISKNLLSPPTQMLKDILETAKDKSKDSPPKQENREGPFLPNENIEVDKVDLDLEDVRGEVDDIFAKSIIQSVEDSIGSAFEEGLQRGKRKREFQAGSNPSPPKTESLSKSTCDYDIGYHNDWELKTALVDPPKPQEKQIQAPMAPSKVLAGVSKSNNSSLWTPALDRRQGQESKLKMIYQGRASDWEVETVYVERKDKTKVQRGDAVTGKETEAGSLPVMTYENVQMTSERIPEQKVEKPTQSNTMLFPSGHSIPVSVPSTVPQTVSHGTMPSISPVSAAVASYGSTALSTPLVPSADLMRELTKARPSASEEGARSSRKLSDECKIRKPSESPKRFKHKRHREKKSKHKKNFSESESDSSDHEERKIKKNSSPETEKEKDEIEALLSKRDSLIKRVKLLVEQKNKMNDQRDDIMKNHKGSRESLSSILDENLFLMKEIGKQIVKINDMVHKVTKEIELKRDAKQTHKSIPRERCESPHHSREKQKKSEHSPERDKHRRASYFHTPDRLQLDTSLSTQAKRPRSPQRKESWSPVPLRHNTQHESCERSGSVERDRNHSRSPQWGEHKRSRSPVHKIPRQNRTGSPNPCFSNESTRQSSTESQKSQSPQKKHPLSNITETSTIETGLQGKGQPEVIKKEIEKKLYAPLDTQRTFIRYMDQGMHWCRLCSIFSETMPEYVDHLMTPSHMARVKNDRKSWLAKAPKEEKEPKPSNAQIVTIPLQGMEFLHTLPAFYCSLCDTFMRDKGEALRHPESKMHISKYKVHRAKNPMYESTFLKAKTTALVKYSVEKARKDLEAQLNLKERNASHEVEEKLLKQSKEKREKDKCDKESRDDKAIIESRDEKNQACGSIRVASRGPARLGDKKSDNQRHVDSSKRRHEGNQAPLQEGLTPKSKLDEEISRKGESQKNEKIHSDHDKGKNDVNIAEYEIAFTTTEEPFKDKEEEKKCAVPKLPLIGKMPFLKRRPTLSKSKEQLKTLPVKQEVPEQKLDLVLGEAKASTFIDIPLPNQEGKDEVKFGKIADSMMFPVNQKSDSPKEESEDKIIAAQEELSSVQDSEEISENNAISVFGDIKDTSPCDPVISIEEYSSELNTWDNEENSDCDDSKMYDILETENDASSECAAAATLHALDALSIQLPGLKPAVDIPPPLDILLPPGTEHETQSQEISKLPLPLRTKDGSSHTYEAGCEPVLEVIESSGVFRNSEIPLPPGTVDISGIQNKTDLPPPPGTEECPNYLPGCDSDAVVVPAKILPVFKPSSQELSSGAWSTGSNNQEDFGVSAFSAGSDRNSNIPLPPGTEDDHCVQEVSNIPPPLGIVEDASMHSGSDHKGIIAQPFIKKHNSKAYSSDSNSLDDIPIPLSGAEITSSSLPLSIGHQHWPVIKTSSRPVALPLSTNFTDWSTLHHTKRECTPPPPGTENLIVNELEDGPAELGEASMELSEGNESEDEHTKREATPPPPGTEDIEKETTPPPPGTELNSRCVTINSAFPKNIPIAKSSLLTSKLKSKLNTKSCKDDFGSKTMPSPNADSNLGLCFNSEEQQIAKLSSQIQQEKEENSIPSQKIAVEMTSDSSSCKMDYVRCFSTKEQSLLFDKKEIDKTKESDVKLQISSGVKLPEYDTDFKDHLVNDCIKSETRHSEDFKGYIAKDRETSNLEVLTCKKEISSPPKCGDVQFARHISVYPEVIESSKGLLNVEVDDIVCKSSENEIKNTKEENPTITSVVESFVSNKYPCKDNEHVGQCSNVDLPPTGGEPDVKLQISPKVKLSDYVTDLKDHQKNYCPESAAQRLQGHIIKEETSNLKVLRIDKGNSSQPECSDVDFAKHSSDYSKKKFESKVCSNVIENTVNKSVKSESNEKEEISTFTSKIESPVLNKDPHKDNEHLEQCINVNWLPVSGIKIAAESSHVGQVGSGKDLDDQDHLKYQLHVCRQDLENWNEIGNHEQVDEKNLTQLDIEGKQSLHEMTKSTLSVTTHEGEKDFRVEKVGLRRTSRSVKPKKEGFHEEDVIQDHSTENIPSRTKATMIDQEEESENIENRLQQQTSESIERSIALEREEPKEEHPSFRKKCRITKALTVQQESKIKQLSGRRSTRGTKASVQTQEEQHRIEPSASLTISTAISVEEEKLELNQSPKKLKLNIKEGVYGKDVEDQILERDLSSMRRTCRTTRSMIAEKPTQRKTARGIKTAVTQEEKSKVEPITSHTTTKVTTTTVLEREQAPMDTVPNKLERVIEVEINEDTEGNEEEYLNMPQCSRVTEISKIVELMDKEEEEESTRRQKTNRSKRAVRNEKTEEKCKTEVPVHKKTRSASGKNIISQKITKVRSPVRIRSSRRAAVAASAAMTAQVQEITPTTNSPSEETS